MSRSRRVAVLKKPSSLSVSESARAEVYAALEQLRTDIQTRYGHQEIDLAAAYFELSGALHDMQRQAWEQFQTLSARLNPQTPTLAMQMQALQRRRQALTRLDSESE